VAANPAKPAKPTRAPRTAKPVEPGAVARDVHPDPSGPDPLDVALGKVIRARRKGLGLSQTALGAAVGLTFQQIQKYERGMNRVSFSKLVGIAAALECRVVDLVDHVERPVSSETVNSSGLLAERGALELLESYSRIGPLSLRKIVIRTAAALGDGPEPEEDTSRSERSGKFASTLTRTNWRQRARWRSKAV